jgi:hypothetical protein
MGFNPAIFLKPFSIVFSIGVDLPGLPPAENSNEKKRFHSASIHT